VGAAEPAIAANRRVRNSLDARREPRSRDHVR